MIFPKDYDFSNIDLIQFWMAHGILQSPKDENVELEDVGDWSSDVCSSDLGA